MQRQRIRDLGLTVGDLPVGVLNSITDVAGVLVGHCTINMGQGKLHPGKGPVRTGVTVILPHAGNLYLQKVPAAVYTINGFGKACGFEQVRELGLIEAPIALTNTLNVGLVLDAMVEYCVQSNPEIGINAPTVNIVVGETNDGYLNDIQGRHVKSEHVFAALQAATGGVVPEGAVGAGTGTCCFGWKGGIGSSSRVLPEELGSFTLGALVQTNFGRPQDLVVCGVPVGKRLLPPGRNVGKPVNAPQPPEQGSVMVVLATDAALDSRQLQRLCVRAAAGLARTGSYFAHGSGDFVIAFSNYHDQTISGRFPLSLLAYEGILNALFQAVVECVEEAVLNSLTCAETIIGRDGHAAYALPISDLLTILSGK
jgi:D-aminopeptidase